MTTYPAQIDTSVTLPTAIDGQTPVHGIIFNRLRDAVMAIEAELGTKPSSVYTNVKTRLETIEANLTTIAAINLSGDVIGSFNATEVASLHGRPLSSVTPTFNQVLGWDGIAWSPVTPTYSNVVGGDLTGIMPNPFVKGLFGYPIENTPPNLLDALIWNGSAWVPAPPFTVGNGLYASGNTINVGMNADQTIIVNSADIQLNPSFYSINPINGTLVQRDTNFGYINVNDAAGSARYGAGILLTAASVFTLQQTQMFSDSPVHDMRIFPQAPYNLATGSNRLPGNLIIDIPSAAGALSSTTSGKISIQFGSIERIKFESDLTAPAGKINFPGNGQMFANTNLNLNSGAHTIITASGNINLGSDQTINITGGVNITDPSGIGIVINSNGGGDLNLISNSGMTINTPSIGLSNHTVGNDITIGVSDNGTSNGESLIIVGGTASVGSGVGGNLNLKAGFGANFSGNIGINMDAPDGDTTTGTFCIYISQTAVVPSSNPVGGIVLYVDTSGNLKARTSAGNIRTIAAV